MDFFLLKLRLRFGRLDLVTHMLDFAEGLAGEERRKLDVKGRRKKGMERENLDVGFEMGKVIKMGCTKWGK